MIKDQFSDMLARIQNASLKNHISVDINFNPLNYSFIKFLLKEKFIAGYLVFLTKKNNKAIKIFLKYNGWWLKKAVITSLSRKSKVHTPEFIKFLKAKKIIKIKEIVTKTLVLTTPNGIMTLDDAISLGCGGKMLCSIN